MGYIMHHAIIVTSWDYTCEQGKELLAETARQKAIEIFGTALVSPMIDSPLNGYKTFFVAPDGSKEGWDDSNEGDKRRAEFKIWLRAQADAPGDNHYDWVEICYGGDEPELNAGVIDYDGKAS